ncbi:MAG TPA: ligase-associated DNA damage response exonuclease [Ferrovibrio sp.]|uniref:ligase-associated DNA damage response exonuclease n=1 Tax=Ferrovibrio sp. TaxID=1917215 RepID=UPI002ED34D91
MDRTNHPSSWLKPTPRGLYVEPGDFYIDPAVAVDRAVITHGHSDHARPGHEHVLATRETLAIMRLRLGAQAGRQQQALGYGEAIDIKGVKLMLAPAGHVLGSAQAVLQWQGFRAVVSGDYKRRRDPTCAAFAVQHCDVFVTEATFGLPIFHHPDDKAEIARLLQSVVLFPDRAHLVGVYALGKAQRVIMLLRETGYDVPIYLHGGLTAMCELYRDLGLALGDLRAVAAAAKAELAGQIVLAPPSARDEPWARRLPDPVNAAASGWFAVKLRARQRGLELPLVISDHADWDELNATLDEVAAPEVWVTHGREEALIHAAGQRGIRARALSLLGYEEDAP